ncbi:MAG: hypothetical protein JSU01_03400 [Bacteroidetes bacterium]|nr:hypothetical protein [Bacteroidota bacterium]
MKTTLNTSAKQLVAKSFLVILFLVSASATFAFPVKTHRDTSISAGIKAQLADLKKQRIFHFPRSVVRFYRRHNFQPVWVKPGDDAKRTWQGVLLINCVLQFGLCHADYHPKEIDYTQLRTILEYPDQVKNDEKARYDLMITDALITFINHLHYGKLNPYLTSAKIDAGADTGFIAGKVLGHALIESNLMSAIIDVQPQTTEYAELEEQMRELTNLEPDCDTLPAPQVRKMAINLERMRWEAVNTETYLAVNIPSFKLVVHVRDATFGFKAIVGAPPTPTPQLNSTLTDFTTAPKLKISRYLNEPPGANPKGVIYFWFKNPFAISMCGHPEKELFTPKERDLSKGNVKIEDGQRLAELLLKIDGNAAEISALRRVISDYGMRNFVLDKPIPFKITYITCEVQNGAVVKYDDIYNLDQKLEAALYNTNEYLVAE